MSSKPIFVATHPRACSTAFERVFMTRQDMTCAHEPFGDAYYYGPERLHDRYEAEDKRDQSGFSKTTYQDVLNRLEKDGSGGKRVFIKDMAYYLMAPDGKPTSLAPSVCRNQAKDRVNGEESNDLKRGIGTTEPGNPTVLPLDVLKKFHFTFLIRHPRRGIPSFFRCTVPPLDEVTGWGKFNANEAGYVELRKLFDFLRAQGLVGPKMAEAAEDPTKSNGINGHANGHANGHINGNTNGHTNGQTNGYTNGQTNGHTNGRKQEEVSITVVDADDLLDHPKEIIEAFCKETGVPFTPDMLNWDDPENQKHVEDAFAKWNGWHNDAIKSKNLSPRKHSHKSLSEETENEEWREKYGEEGAKEIRACVDENVPHYEYLKQFAIKVENLGI